jgi:ABC-type phosphate transport system ATPase subunit
LRAHGIERVCRRSFLRDGCGWPGGSKDSCTPIIVTRNMHQAARASDYIAFMLDGTLIEYNDTSRLFTTPANPRTEAYVTGRLE